MNSTELIDHIIERSKERAIFSESAAYFIAALRQVLVEELQDEVAQHSLLKLSQKWRANAVVRDGNMTYVNHAYYQCADELERALVKNLTV